MTVDVAVWLGIKGGKDAEREFQQFGRSGKAALTEVKEAARALPPHLVAVSRGVAGIKSGVEDLAARTGTVGKMASSFGVAGLAVAGVSAAVGLAAVAMVRTTRAAMQMGDEIADSAEQARVSTDTLQELRFAVHASGGEFQDADQAILQFQQRLGEARGGLEKSLKWFERLGFTKEQIKSFGSVDEALDAVTKKIAGLGNEQEALAAANKLGLGSMYPLIRKGADEMDRLRKAAHDLGFVMSEDVVKRLGEANDKFEESSHIIDVQFKSAFVELAPYILKVASAIAHLAQELGNLASRSDVKEGVAIVGKLAGGYAKGGVAGMGSAAGDIITRKVRGEKIAGPDWSKFAAPDRSFTTGDPNASLIDVDGNAKAEAAAAKAAAKAKAAAAKAAAELDRYMNALTQARQNQSEEYLAGLKMSGTVEERFALQTSMLGLERKEREAELDRMVSSGELTAAHAARLKDAEEEVRQGKLANLRAEEHRALEDKRLEQEKALADLNDELLQLALAGARTAAERRQLELKALEARRTAERHDLEVKLGRDPDLTDAQRQARLDGFDASTAGQRQGVERGTMGPLDQFRDGFLRSADEIDEAFQQIAVNGLEQLSDGLVDAIMQAKDLGDVFSSVADTIVAGLLRIAIQQAILKPFADWLGGGASGGAGGGSGGSVWDTIAQAAGSILGGKFGGGDWANYGSYGASPGGPTMTNSAGAPWYMRTLGGRASGGPVYRGDRRPVGEYGIEMLAANSDGYVFDHAATARQMAASRAVGGGGSGGGPIQVNLRNASGTPLQATARERHDGAGGRTLDIDLVDLIDSRADARVRDLTEGRRDDVSLSRNFGVRRNLSGS